MLDSDPTTRSQPRTGRPDPGRPDPGRRRRSRVAAALGMAVAGTCLVAAAPVASAAAPAAKPGVIGAPLKIADQGQFDAYDVVTTAAGKTFVGWISAATSSNGRLVHLCEVPAGGLSCAGGVRTVASLGPSSAEGLRVLAAPSGAVTLVWFHDTSPGSVDGPRGGRIAEATVGAGGVLNAPVDVGDAPSFGSMVAAGIGPDHKIWTVDDSAAGGGPLEVRDGTGPDVKVAIPWPYAAFVSLAFSGPTPILVASQAGEIIKPVFTASRKATGWTRFAAVGGTWSVGTDVGLTATSSGVKLITSVNNSGYHPVVAAWNGYAFGRPALIGDTNSCAPTSHDTATDASGRLVDVSIECNQIAVDNLGTKKKKGGIVRFSTRGTTAGGTPQIATTAGGRAIVAWSVEDAATSNDGLYLAAVRLPETLRKK